MSEPIPFDEKLPAAPFMISESVKTVMESHERAMPELVMEIAKAMFGTGKVRPDEYFRMRLFDTANVTREELSRFTGRRFEEPHNFKVNDAGWRAFAENKIVFQAFLTGLGFPVPEMLGVFHPTRSMGPNIPVFRSAERLADFLGDPDHYPLFIKPNELSWSLGALSLKEVSGTEVQDLFGRVSSTREVAERIASMDDGTGFLLQRTQFNHPDLAAICGPALATVRILACREGAETSILRTHIKLPTGKNVADNTWRSGNLVVEIDPETGVLGRGWMGTGIAATEHTIHPSTAAPLQGTLPRWDEAVALVKDATQATEGLRLLGWDVAFTPDGPVLIEANSDPDWTVNQRLTGKGMLTPSFQDFLSRY